MTQLDRTTRELLAAMEVPPAKGMPPAEFVVAPATIADAAEVLAVASVTGLAVTPWGGGTHRGIGYSTEPSIVLSTENFTSIVDWQREDLTVVVEAGVRVADLESMLAGEGQTAVLPETPGVSTIGGTLAVGASAWRRLRYGPTRDRVLEVVAATGDGRVVRSGAPVVKNVTGYDIPRLMVGSLGGLGLIGRVCLKLWPAAMTTATVAVADAVAAFRTAFRPLAVLETEEGSAVYLGGTANEVEAQAEELGADARAGLTWPEPMATPWQLELRVPPRQVAAGVARVRAVPDVRFVAAHGVGTVSVGGGDLSAEWVESTREWAEQLGGALVVIDQPSGAEIDPWGRPPASLDLQRRVKMAFDPAGVVNRGRLAGRL